jgi:fluoroquinolone transport system permease protein
VTAPAAWMGVRARVTRVGGRSRLNHLLRWEAVVQWRYGIVALVGAVTLAWTGLLAALPQSAARGAAPWVLMLDTAVLGTTLVGALVLLEREQGMRAAFQVSPARVGERMVAKIGLLAALVVAAAVPIAVAGRPMSAGGVLTTVVGVGLVAALTMLLAVAVAARRQNVISFMIALPMVLLPLVAPALAHLAGLGHPLLYVVPTVGGMDLIAAGYAGPAERPAAPTVALLVAWLVISCVGAAAVAGRRLRGATAAGAVRYVEHTAVPAPSANGRTPDSSPARALVAEPNSRGGTPVRAFLRADLASIVRDPLLLLIGASPVLLGLGLRFGYPPVHAWLASAYGFDLHPHRPLLLAVAVVLHVPVIFGMIGALMVLDDADSRALTALRVSPLTLPRYLAYRAGLISVAAAAGLGVAVPLSALAPVGELARLLPSVALAVMVAPLVMLTTLAIAGNKVEGVAMLKLLGLPAYLPVAAWWLDGATGWLPAPLPTWWLVRSLWDAPGGWYAAGGLLLAAAALALAASRAWRRLAGSAAR